MGSKHGTECNLGGLVWDGLKDTAVSWVIATASFVLICLIIDGRLF